jgi:hypothetical protein
MNRCYYTLIAALRSSKVEVAQQCAARTAAVTEIRFSNCQHPLSLSLATAAHLAAVRNRGMAR